LLAAPQHRPHRGLHTGTTEQRTTDQDTAPVLSRSPVDAARVRGEAEELAKLAQSVQVGVERAEKGVVSKDLGENLKKIQKLSKRLRGELSL
jgi:hypothetical protein